MTGFFKGLPLPAQIGLGVTFPFIAGPLLLAGALAPEKPETSSGTQRRLALAADPESPWELVYGTAVKGGQVTWQGIGGSHDQMTLIDVVIASHACAEVTHIQVNDWCFPIVTDPAGDANYNGKGLIRQDQAGWVETASAIPGDWLIPVRSSNWVQSNQAIKENIQVGHIRCKIYYGDQAGTDGHMDAVAKGDSYSAKGPKKYIGHTVIHLILRTNTNLLGLGQVPDLKFRIRGKNNLVLSDDGMTTGYSALAVPVLVDFLKERYGVPYTAIVNHQGGALESLIAECAATGWDSHEDPAALYEFHGVIRDDEDGVDVIKRICNHFLGGIGPRGDKIVVWTGGIKTPWTDGPLTVDDLKSGVSLSSPSADTWVNTLKAHYTPHFAKDAKDKTVLAGQMKPADDVATQASYVTEDDGQELIRDYKPEGCDLSRRAVWMAQCELDAVRLGSQFTARFGRRASVLEVGDVTVVDLPFISDTALDWQVIRKREVDPLSAFVELTFRRYADALYTPQSVSEDAIGVTAGWRTDELAGVTGLGAYTIGTGRQTADGAITVDAGFLWDAPEDARVANGGSIDIEWRLLGDDWPGVAIQAAARPGVTTASGFLVGGIYYLRAKFRGSPSAGLGDGAESAWSADVLFEPDLPAGVYPAGFTEALAFGRLPDGFFLRDYDSDVGDGLTWGGHAVVNADGIGTTPVGRALVMAGDGYWGVVRNGVVTTTRLRLQMTAGDINDSQSVVALSFVPVRPGETLTVAVAAAFETAARLQLVVLWYDAARVYVSENVALTETSAADGGGFTWGSADFTWGSADFSWGKQAVTWRHLSATVVVPAGISFVRVQVKQILTASAPQTVSVDGVLLQ